MKISSDSCQNKEKTLETDADDLTTGHLSENRKKKTEHLTIGEDLKERNEERSHLHEH